MDESILSHDQGRVRTLTLNRPDRRNALTHGLLLDLRDHLDAAEVASMAVVVIRAEGTVFCAGHDLEEMTRLDARGLSALFSDCSALMASIRRRPFVAVAAVEGPAIAGGCHLACACDLVVCGDRAGFSVPAARLGLSGATATAEVARLVGRGRALRMAVGGEIIDAATAVRWGLATHHLPGPGFAAALDEVIAPLVDCSPAVLRRILGDLDAALALAPEAAAPVAGAAMAASAGSPEGREGVAAFLERRAPVWPSGGVAD